MLHSDPFSTGQLWTPPYPSDWCDAPPLPSYPFSSHSSPRLPAASVDFPSSLWQLPTLSPPPLSLDEGHSCTLPLRQPSTLPSSPSSFLTFPSPPPPPPPSKSFTNSNSSLPSKRRRTVEAVPTKPSHLELDARRRQKERATLKKLEELTLTGERERLGAGKGTGKRKKERLTVMEESVEEIERLRALVDRLTSAANAKDERVEALARHLGSVSERHRRASSLLQLEDNMTSFPSSCCSHSSTSSTLSLLPTSTSHYLSTLDNDHALYSSLFLQARVALFLMELSTSRVLDMNSHFNALTGWSRHQLLGRLIAVGQRALGDLEDDPVTPQLTDDEMRERPLIRVKKSRPGKGGEVVEEYEWRPAPVIRQYPASLRQAQEMAEGKLQMMRGLWRCVWADGGQYEVMATAWGSGYIVEQREDGTMWERPTHAVFGSSLGGHVKVEEAVA